VILTRLDTTFSSWTVCCCVFSADMGRQKRMEMEMRMRNVVGNIFQVA
jgi:hypothetical protein